MSRQSEPPSWRTSSYTERQDCVELADLKDGIIGIRDSKNPGGPHLRVFREDLLNFINRIKAKAVGP